MKVDRYELHQRFWDEADRLGRCLIYQKELAAQLDVTQATMSIIIGELVDEGRIKKISAKQRNIGVYLIRDPILFPHAFDPVSIPGLDVVRCRKCGDLYPVGRHLDL